MDVLLLSPGFPAEMPLFARGLAQVGARVHGVGDQGPEALDPELARVLSGYLQVGNLWDEAAVAAQVAAWLGGRTPERIECLWEPGMLLAARLRETLGVPGLRVEETVPFRDKVAMKEVLERAGVRTPRHARARSVAEVHEAAERFGYPLIVKPVAGAGSADTYAVRGPDELGSAIELVRHVPEVSVEEYVEGEEHTFDAVTADGRILFENIAWYRPKPLVARLEGWISPQAVCLRDLEAPELARGRELGRAVLRALGFGTGFTHMEWFRTPSGEAVFGEIGARPPGGRLVHVMNYSTDGDLFRGWAEAVCHGRLGQDLSKRYNAAVVFKRAQGDGPRIVAVEGLEGLRERYSESVAHLELARPGDLRRDWRAVIVGDGWIVVRHPDLGRTLEIADRFSSELVIRAG